MHGQVWGLSCKPNIFVSWSTSELRVRLAPWNRFISPPVKYFNWPFQGGTSFVDHLCYLCLVFVMLLLLSIAALWSPAGKGLTSCPWLLFVMFNCIFSLSHVVSWVRCGTWLYRLLFFVTFLTLFYCVYHKFVKLKWKLFGYFGGAPKYFLWKSHRILSNLP